MYQLITIEVLALDAEQNITIVSRRGNHHRRGLAGAEGIFVHHNFNAARPVSQFGRGVGGDKDSCLGGDRRQQASPSTCPLTALPGNAIVAVALRNKIELARSLSICLYCLGENIVMLITAELQLPPF